MSITMSLKWLCATICLSLSTLLLTPLAASASQFQKTSATTFTDGTARLTVVVCDGWGRPLPENSVDIRVKTERGGDTFTIKASAPGFQASELEHLTLPPEGGTVYLMLRPKHARFDLNDVTFEHLPLSDPELFQRIICQSLAAENCEAAYNDLLLHRRDKLAALINMAAALEHMKIGGRSAFSYFQAVSFDDTLQRDRFYAYIDRAVVLQLKATTAAGPCGVQSGETCFTRLRFFRLLHHNATSSFKETDLDRANVQLTFNEKDVRTINGIECVRVETDIDYYRGLAHAFKEVLPNLLLRRKSDPRRVFYLRWMATRQKRSQGARIDPFTPPLGLTGR